MRIYAQHNCITYIVVYIDLGSIAPVLWYGLHPKLFSSYHKDEIKIIRENKLASGSSCPSILKGVHIKLINHETLKGMEMRNGYFRVLNKTSKLAYIPIANLPLESAVISSNNFNLTTIK